METHYGATEILQCDVDGNPTPEILWYHEDSERKVASSPNISVFVSPDTAGRYYCKAHVPGFPELTGHANIYIRAPPSIVSQRIQYVPDEGVVKVRTCIFLCSLTRDRVRSFEYRGQARRRLSGRKETRVIFLSAVAPAGTPARACIS